MHFKARYFLAALVLLSSVMQPLHAAGKALVLGVHPYLPPAEIQKRFRPFAKYLAEQLGRPVVVRVGGDYQEHMDAIGKNLVDIAFMGPAAYVGMVERYGQKTLLARFKVNGNPHLFGVIATRKQSGIDSLEELADKRFAFGDPNSTMSHMIPRYLLMRAGIKDGLPSDYQYLGSHKNVALGVLTGDFDAGAMKKEVFDEYKAKGLRAIAVTPGVPDHLFVARNHLPASDIKKLHQSMLTLSQQPQGQRIMKKMHKKLTALVAARNEDYNELREMISTVRAADR